ncbi:sigma-70 family RNA polymerase sigma factor [Longispora sp. NPDC051575]|uniref:sigma-70 family RNA polymerase sigma factor n=1 Tax=Longispora sp. NPDC051575 TaxID=3154943 RepID=UPI003421606A
MQTDASLATAASFGDRGAFGELYARHSPELLGFVTRLTGDRHLAEDVVQDCFLVAWRDLSGLRDPAAVKSWLFGIAYRRAMEQFRHAGPTPVADVPDVVDHAPGANPDTVAEQREAAALVWTAAQGLEPRQRAVLELSVRWDLSSAEIGQVLGVGRAHASVLVHRTRSALGNAVRTLLVARQHGRCDGLDALVERSSRLSARQRSSVDHHIRRCAACRGLGARVGSATLLIALYAAADAALSGPGGTPVPVAARTPLAENAAARHASPSRNGLVGAASAVAIVLALGGVGAYALRPGQNGAANAGTQATAPEVQEARMDVNPTPSVSPTPSPTPSPSPTKKPTTAPPKPAATGSLENQILVLVNQRRAEAGCGPVHYDTKLGKAAYDHSADMVARNYFSHDTPDGVSPWDRAKAAGYNEPSSENIAAGNATAEGTMKQWMNSPGHKANILNCSSKAMGVGRATGGSYRYYWTQMFGYK